MMIMSLASFLIWPIRHFDGGIQLIAFIGMALVFAVTAGGLSSMTGGISGTPLRNLVFTLAAVVVLWLGEMVGAGLLSNLGFGLERSVWGLIGMAALSLIVTVPLIGWLKKTTYWSALAAWAVGVFAAVVLALFAQSLLAGVEGTKGLLDRDRKRTQDMENMIGQ